jgi:hypothetical protein
MTAMATPIDLFSLLKTGRSGPLEFGITDRDAVSVRSLIRRISEQTITGSMVIRHRLGASMGVIANSSSARIFRLRHIKLIPDRSFLAFGGETVRWTGKLELQIGRHSVNFGGATPLGSGPINSA